MSVAGWFLRPWLDGVVFAATVVVAARSEHWKIDNHGLFLVGLSVLALTASVIVRRKPGRSTRESGNASLS